MTSSHPFSDLTELNPESVAAWLESTGQFKVLRRVLPQTHLGGRVDHPVKVILLDTETTGLEFDSSEMIELGAIALEVDRDTGAIGAVLGTFGGLEQPSVPIPAESTAIHGITDEMVKGQRFDEAAFQDLCKGAALFIAHNAAFDKPFVLERFPWLDQSIWACTFREIPWDQEGYSGKKLEYLLSECGFFHGAHRAVEDCMALAHVLNQALKTSHRMPMQVLFESANEAMYEIAAIQSPFDKKDIMKARGFRWNAEDRVWQIEVFGFAEGKAIIEFLREQVYCTPGKIKLGFRTRSGASRYSKAEVKQQFKDV